MQPSLQQQAAIDAVQDPNGGNLILEAVAGSGKTSTLLMMVAVMKGDVAFTAYNRAIAMEIAAKVGKITTAARVKAGTFHSFGYGAIMQACPKAKMDDKKVYRLMNTAKVPGGLERFVAQLVSLAKQNGVGVLTPFDRAESWWELVRHHDLETMLLSNPWKRDEFSEAELECMVKDGMRYAQTVLQLCIEDRSAFDFDDMIYLPLVYNARVRQYDWVLIDEAQDTNPARRALAKKMLKVGGRLVAVGDPHQAIYGFTGADADSLGLIAREFHTRTLPLSVTYRCPRAVVQLARTIVSHIDPAPNAAEGSVSVVSDGDFRKTILPTLTGEDVVLCRNVRPLVDLAYSLIKQGKGCHVEGREIGRGLMVLVNKWTRGVDTIDAYRERLTAYLAHETSQLMAKGEETKAAAITDKVETLLVICGNLPDDAPRSTLAAEITKLFEDTEPGQARTLTLSTIHKSKGREWARVYLYGRNKFMPSPFARQDWQHEQERNLAYVAVTRATAEFVDVTA